MEINPQEQVNDLEHDVTTPMNPNGRPIIIISIILITTGQSLARLLETFYQHHNTNQSLHGRVLTQPLLQVIGFPLLILPFFLLKKQSQLLITFQPTSLLLLYLCTGVVMVVQIKLYTKGKLETSNTKFLLFEATQVYFTIIFTTIAKRIKFNTWFFISIIFTITITTTTTLSSKVSGEWSALLAAVTFSFLLSNILYISTRNNRKPIFADVLELLIFSSLFATIAAASISGQNHSLKREMNGFSKGKFAYVVTMVGQTIAWQMYWVGLVGLVVFTESIVTSNMVSLGTYSIETSLKILLCNYEEDEFDSYLGGALILHIFSVVISFHKHIKFFRGIGNWKPPRFLSFLFLVVVYYFYSSELLRPDDYYISPPSEFEFF